MPTVSKADIAVTVSLIIKITRRSSVFIISGRKAGELPPPRRLGHLRDDDEPRPRSLPPSLPLPPFFLRRFLSPFPRDLPDPPDPADEERGRNWLLPRLLKLSLDPDRPREVLADPFELARELAREEPLELGCDAAGAAAFRSASVSLYLGRLPCRSHRSFSH